jgi:hypothetical protein
MNMKMKLGHGVFTWGGEERRSDRYGAFLLCAEPYAGAAPVTGVTYDKDLAEELEDKRVRLVAKVVETRKSGHLGDLFLGIRPSTPEVGEEIDLGVGILHTEPCDWDSKATSTFLVPGDPPTRERFWFDPNKLYRLHDQTVEVFVEETSDDLTPGWTPPDRSEVGAVANGDGSFQMKGVEVADGTKLKIKPKVERLGDGLFMMGGTRGARVRLDF